MEGATRPQLAGQLRLVRAIELLNVEYQFVQLQGIVIDLPQLDLPGANVRGVVEHVLQFVEVNERAFDLFEIHLLDLGTAREVAEEPWQRASAMRALLVGQAAVREIAGAITQDHGAPRVERCEHQLTWLSWWERPAGLRINHFHDAEVGIKMITASAFVMWERTFGPGQLGFGETVRGQHVHVSRAQFERDIT